MLYLTRFNKIATQGAPQMAVDKEANSLSRVYSYYSKFNILVSRRRRSKCFILVSCHEEGEASVLL